MSFFSRRLLVVGLVPYRENTKINLTTFSDQGLRWMFDPANPISFVRYWKDATNGLVDINVTVSGWHFIESDEVYNRIYVKDISQDNSRQVATQGACDVALEAGLDVTSFDGLLFFISGFGVSAGYQEVIVEGRVIPASIFDELQTHTFIAHEIGHVLGCDHPFHQGSPTPEYPLGEYRDPTCIMSAKNFGGFGHIVAPKVEVAPDVGINPNALFWQQGGPGPAFTTVWRYLGAFPQIPHWAKALPAKPALTTLKLHSAASVASGSRLAIIATGLEFPTYYTLEFRPATGWDKGFNFVPGAMHNTLTSPGVIIHQIVDIGLTSNQAGWPKLQRVDYVATIPVPSAGNQDWSCPLFGVRVKDVDPDLNWVEIQVADQLPPIHEASLEISHKAGRATRSSDGNVTIQWAGLTCTPQTFKAEFVDREQTIIVNTMAAGFINPEFSFMVNGELIPAVGHLSRKTRSDSIVIIAEVNRPTGYGTAVKAQKVMILSYRVAVNRLELTVPKRQGDVTLKIIATVSEKASSIASASVSATKTLSVVTRSIELSDEAKKGIRACHAAIVAKVKEAFPHGKIPKSELIPIPKHWGELPINKLPFALGSIIQLSKTNQLKGEIEIKRAAQEIGIPDQELAMLTKEIGKRLIK